MKGHETAVYVFALMEAAYNCLVYSLGRLEKKRKKKSSERLIIDLYTSPPGLFSRQKHTPRLKDKRLRSRTYRSPECSEHECLPFFKNKRDPSGAWPAAKQKHKQTNSSICCGRIHII